MLPIAGVTMALADADGPGSEPSSNCHSQHIDPPPCVVDTTATSQG